MSKKYKSGDVVMLNSGGPEMTVQEYKTTIDENLQNIDTEYVLCVWFDGKNRKQDYFHQEGLTDEF